MTKPGHKISKLRNVNDVALAIEKYRHEVTMCEHELLSSLKNVGKTFGESVREKVLAYTLPRITVKVIKWVKSTLYNRRKKKREKNNAG